MDARQLVEEKKRGGQKGGSIRLGTGIRPHHLPKLQTENRETDYSGHFIISEEGTVTSNKVTNQKRIHSLPWI